MNKISYANVYFSIVIVIVAAIILYLINKFLVKKLAYKKKGNQHVREILGFVFNILQYAVIIFAILLILDINGINVVGLFAGLGIVATIIGLSLQDTLKDIFAGLSIYNNNFYRIGDVVMYNNRKCEVKYFSARITKFQDILTNSTYTVNNSTITSIEKVKDKRMFNVTFDMSDNKKKIDKVFNNVVKSLKNDKTIKNVEYLGIYSIDDEGVHYVLQFEAPASDYKADVRIYLNIYEELAKVKLAPNTSDSIKIKSDPWDN